MIFYCFPFTILLGMNCRVSCVISYFFAHFNSDIVCDYYITKLFTFTFNFRHLSATDSFTNLWRLEIYCQYICWLHSLGITWQMYFVKVPSSSHQMHIQDSASRVDVKTNIFTTLSVTLWKTYSGMMCTRNKNFECTFIRFIMDK